MAGAEPAGLGRPNPSKLTADQFPTLGDLMKDRDAAAQVVSVAGKDRAAIMMGGHKADELMWLVPTGLTSYRGTTLSPTASSAASGGEVERGSTLTPPAAGSISGTSRGMLVARA